MATITEHEAEQVRKANESGKTPVVFVHGLWLLPSSWQSWLDLFEAAGYAPSGAGLARRSGRRSRRRGPTRRRSPARAWSRSPTISPR